MTYEAKSFAPVSREDFLDFIEKADGRFEFENGLIVQQMPGATRRHQRIVVNVIREISRQIDTSAFEVFPEFGVDTPTSCRFPDIVVGPANEPEDLQSTSSPCLIVEVLSPSSRSRDLSRKPGEYLQLASLHAYIVISQDAPEVLAWRRGIDGAMNAEPVEVIGLNQTLALPSLDITLPLAHIFARITFADATEAGTQND